MKIVFIFALLVAPKPILPGENVSCEVPVKIDVIDLASTDYSQRLHFWACVDRDLHGNPIYTYY